MYLEVVSRSFTIQVAEGLSLNQIRLINGSAKPDPADLLRTHALQPILYEYDLEGKNPQPVVEIDPTQGIFLRVDLVGDAEKFVGYRAKKNSALLNLAKVGGHRAEDFWDRVESDRHNRLILEPEDFYLLVSLEGVSVPPTLAGEMTAYDPTSGELRTHYAGFFDPGFGFGPGAQGSRAVLEVRAHDVPFALEHRQRIARLEFENMMRPPEKLYGPDIGSSYQNQRLKLSKHFKEPTVKASHQMAFDLVSNLQAPSLLH